MTRSVRSWGASATGFYTLTTSWYVTIHRERDTASLACRKTAELRYHETRDLAERYARKTGKFWWFCQKPMCFNGEEPRRPPGI